MKSFLKSWLAPMGVCATLAFVAVSGNRWVTAQPQAPEVPGVALASDELEVPVSEADDDDDENDDDDELEMEIEVDVSDAIEIEVDGMDDADAEGADDDGAEPGPASPDDENDNDRSEEFENRSEELVNQIQEAKSNRNVNQVQELKQELQNVTREHFEWLESKRHEQVKALEARLETLKQVLESRSQNADQIIERRVKKLLGESDTLDWNPKLDARDSWRGRPARPGAEEVRRLSEEAAELAVRSARSAERNLALNRNGLKELRTQLEASRLDALRSKPAELRDRLSAGIASELEAVNAARRDGARQRTEQSPGVEARRNELNQLEAQLRSLEEQKRVLSEQLGKTKARQR